MSVALAWYALRPKLLASHLIASFALLFHVKSPKKKRLREVRGVEHPINTSVLTHHPYLGVALLVFPSACRAVRPLPLSPQTFRQTIIGRCGLGPYIRAMLCRRMRCRKFLHRRGLDRRRCAVVCAVTLISQRALVFIRTAEATAPLEAYVPACGRRFCSVICGSRLIGANGWHTQAFHLMLWGSLIMNPGTCALP